MQRLNALIIDPNIETRTNLKELLHNEQLFGQLVYQGVFLVGSLIDGIIQLTEGSGIDVIFISSRFSVPEIESFITTAKEHEQRDGTVYVVVFDGGDQGTDHVAQGIIAGAEGFLILPCSVEQLREITHIAQRLKLAAHERMMKVALTLLVDTILAEIDAKVLDYYQYRRITRYRKQFRDAAEALLSESKQMRDQFIELLQEVTARAKPSSPNGRPPMSVRVDKKRRLRRAQRVGGLLSNKPEKQKGKRAEG